MKLKLLTKLNSNKLALFSLMIVAFLLTACTTIPESSIPAAKVCQTDSDCVPAQCCHAKDAVNRENAPDCSDAICTLECAPGTIDCNQGSVACKEGACTVILDTGSTY